MAEMFDDTIIAVIDGPGNLEPNAVTSSSITFAAALLAVGLRFLARRTARISLGWDDWLVLLAMIVGLVEFGFSIWWFSIGGAKYIGEVTPARLRQAITIVFTVELCWATVLFLTRASALVLWRRIFPQSWLKYFCWVIRVLNFLLWVSNILTTCLQCHPTWYLFHPLEAPMGACIGVKTSYLATGVASVILDAIVIGLPMALVWQLQLNRTLRLAVCALFLTSSLTIVATIVRIHILLSSDLTAQAQLNVTWEYGEIGYWVVVESYIAITATCLPCLRPLLAHVVPRSWISGPSASRSKRPSGKTEDDAAEPSESGRRSDRRRSISISTDTSAG